MAPHCLYSKVNVTRDGLSWPSAALLADHLSLNHDSHFKAFLPFAHVDPSAQNALYPSSAQEPPLPWGFPKLIIPSSSLFLILVTLCFALTHLFIQYLLSTYHVPGLSLFPMKCEFHKVRPFAVFLLSTQNATGHIISHEQADGRE